MQPYKDPDEFIKNLGAEEFQKRIDEAENSFLFEIRILQREYDQQDPESRTKFQREVAKKLCGFSEDAERDNYTIAVADKFQIGLENLRKLVISYAAQTGLAKPIERPKSGVQPKNTPEESRKKAQRLLITWIADEPALYDKIKKYISAKDFTDPLYSQVAERLFADLETGSYHPAAIIDMFTDEEQQRQAAALFHTQLPQSEEMNREKAFHDIVYSVKKDSYEYYSSRLGADVKALNKVIEGKKALEELGKTRISLE